MDALFLVKDEVPHQLEGVHENFLEIQEIGRVLLVSNLFERDRLVGEGAQTSLFAHAILCELGYKLAFVSKV